MRRGRDEGGVCSPVVDALASRAEDDEDNEEDEDDDEDEVSFLGGEAVGVRFVFGSSSFAATPTAMHNFRRSAVVGSKKFCGGHLLDEDERRRSEHAMLHRHAHPFVPSSSSSTDDTEEDVEDDNDFFRFVFRSARVGRMVVVIPHSSSSSCGTHSFSSQATPVRGSAVAEEEEREEADEWEEAVWDTTSSS